MLGLLIQLINQVTRSMILFNRRKLKNLNGFIFGVSGAGKGVIAKLEIIFTSLATNEEIIIIDPEGEYGRLVAFFGGEVIKISATSAVRINPLDLSENPDPTDTSYNAVTEKLDFLLSFFAAILNVDEIQPLQRRVIEAAMIDTYDRHQMPTLKEYYGELEAFENTCSGEMKRVTEFLKNALYPYVYGTMKMFAEQSNVNINKRLVVYDIKELPKNMYTLGMMIVCENVWKRIAQNRIKEIGTRVYVDEMHLFFKSEQCAEFFTILFKRARKWGAVPTGITQNVEDVLRSETARTMLSNTQFVLMLSQNPTDIDVLSEVLRISNDTMQKYVKNSSVGCGLMYLGKYGCIPFDNRISTDTEIYRLVDTTFGKKLDEVEK